MIQVLPMSHQNETCIWEFTLHLVLLKVVLWLLNMLKPFFQMYYIHGCAYLTDCLLIVKIFFKKVDLGTSQNSNLLVEEIVVTALLGNILTLLMQIMA